MTDWIEAVLEAVEGEDGEIFPVRWVDGFLGEIGAQRGDGGRGMGIDAPACGLVRNDRREDEGGHPQSRRGRDSSLPEGAPLRGAGGRGGSPSARYGGHLPRQREAGTGDGPPLQAGDWLAMTWRRARGAAEYAAGRRREAVAVAVPVEAGGGGAVSAEELDRVFQRDARRYDGGFPLY